MRASPGPRHRSATAPVPGAPLSIPLKHSRGPPVYKRPARQTEKGARKKKKKKNTPNCVPGRQSCKAAPPPTAQAGCPLAPGRQARKTASTSTPNCMPPNLARRHLHQRPKLPACPQHPAVTSTLNCMPPSTRPLH